METALKEKKPFFYVKFENTQRNLTLLAFLQAFCGNSFAVYDSPEDIAADNKNEKDYSSIYRQLENYNPVYDEEYLAQLSSKATPNWQKIGNTDKWLRDLRGGQDNLQNINNRGCRIRCR